MSRRIANPWRTRSQKARTRVESTAKATSPTTPSNVIKKSVKRKCDAKNEMSKELSFEKLGGLGKTPWVKAKTSTSTPTVASKMDSTKKAAATVGYRDPGIEERVRKRLMTSPPRAGTTLLKPTAAK